MSAIKLAADFIAPREGNALVAYKDVGQGVWTIGKGHTGPEVVEGLVWTQAQVDWAFQSDLEKKFSSVNRMKHRMLTDGQIAALIAIDFNVPESQLQTSQLLAAVNDCRWLDAAHEWVRWDHAGGREIKGLLIRRLEEAVMFLKASP